jgi:competence ComEA-like helix-hairpin-helix protein
MQSLNPYYFNAYIQHGKPLLLLICCFLYACSGQNNTKQILSTEKHVQASGLAININNASAAELEKLPHVGKQTAMEIVEHRAKFGKFRRPEHLMFVRGISDERFREIKNFVKVE